jgi:molybdopterin converting factor small subunit
MAITVTVTFYSYFKELTGNASTVETLPPGSTLGDLAERLAARFPHLAGLRNSMLMAVGFEYQPRGYALRPGDEVACFPPVQGG